LTGGLDASQIARGKYDRRTFAKEAMNNGLADTHGGSGDDDCFSWNAHAELLLSQRAKVKPGKVTQEILRNV
jgi:hypothetical protein